MRALIVWEDANYESLAAIARRRLAIRRPSGIGVYPELLFHTARGNGKFLNYAASTWEKIRSKGLPNNAGPIDHLICVADGDRLADLVLGVTSPPEHANDVSGWLMTTEQSFEAHLRGGAGNSSVPPSTVHGVVLRWSKESLLLGAYDRAAMKEHLDVDVQCAPVQTFLQKCVPPPTTVPTSLFSDTYRHPMRCIHALRKAQGLHDVNKKAADIDDVLRALSGTDLTVVCDRVPDMDRVLDRVWSLCG